jgi:hypothetical protein
MKSLSPISYTLTVNATIIPCTDWAEFFFEVKKEFLPQRKKDDHTRRTHTQNPVLERQDSGLKFLKFRGSIGF